MGSFHLESCKASTCLRCCSYYVLTLGYNVSIELAESCENQPNSATGQSVSPSEFRGCRARMGCAAWRQLPSFLALKCTPPLLRRAVSWEPIILLGFSVLTGDRECFSLAPSATFWKKLPRTEVMFIQRTGSEENLLSQVGNDSWVPWVTPELTEHSAVPNTLCCMPKSQMEKV